MRCELNFFWDEDDAVDVIETLYRMAFNQKEDLIIVINNETYTIPVWLNKDLRVKKARGIYRRYAKSPNWGKS